MSNIIKINQQTYDSATKLFANKFFSQSHKESLIISYESSNPVINFGCKITVNFNKQFTLQYVVIGDEGLVVEKKMDLECLDDILNFVIYQKPFKFPNGEEVTADISGVNLHGSIPVSIDSIIDTKLIKEKIEGFSKMVKRESNAVKLSSLFEGNGVSIIQGMSR